MAAHRKPMPAQRAPVSVDGRYTHAAFDRIRRGHMSSDMDDKWNMMFEEPWLYLCRSWTGLCIFQLRFERTETGARIAEAWANRDAEQYRSHGEEAERELIRTLVNRLAGIP